MRVLFLGTPDFAVATLEAIHRSENHQIVGVVTVPDRPAGRGRKLRPSAVAEKAAEFNLPTLKPEKMRDESFLEAVRELNPDIAVVVAFRMMPEVLWSLPPKGTFNIHASLLPNYRGAAPINWAIINGESKTGVTSFLLDQQIDTGKILLRSETKIGSDETAGELHDRLMHLGAELAVRTLNEMEVEKLKPIPQDQLTVNQNLNHAPKIFKGDTIIQLEQSTTSIHNFIRGLSPYPGAVFPCIVDHESVDVKILRTKKTEKAPSSENGISIQNGAIYLISSDGALEVRELQFPGKRAMDAKSFLAGWKGATHWPVRNA